MSSRRLIPLVLALGFSLLGLPLGCGSDSVKSPFGPAAGGAGGEGVTQGEGGFQLIIGDGGRGDVDPTLGGPCEDDGQCNDELDCTVDRCDAAIGHCRFEPDDARCSPGTYCGGGERCDVHLGCTPGEVVSCSDDDTCTIDTCVEETQSCRHDPRDADGDGDPTHNCGGQDCADEDPLVSSRASEVCNNRIDDDCDGEIDEADCAAPEYDSCDEALRAPLLAGKRHYFDVDLTATKLDYPSKCAAEKAGFRDAVLDLVVPDGGPYDVDVTAQLNLDVTDDQTDAESNLALGTATACGDEASARCERSFFTPVGGSMARLILRRAEPGSHPLYVAANQEATVQVRVELRPAEQQRGDSCEDAVRLVAGGPAELFRLPGYERDARSLCTPLTGDAFAAFTLTDPADITLVAEARNDLAKPVISLLDGICKGELTCRKSQPGRLFVRNLPPGEYRALVAGTAPDDVSIRLETGPVSEAPPGEGCDDAPSLVAGEERLVDLATHEDAVYTGCLVGAPDATFEFDSDGRRDVALIGRFSAGDEGAVSLAEPGCSDYRICSEGGVTERAVAYGLPAGSYRAVIESARGNPVGLTWFERPAVAPLQVPFADNCDGAVTIPETGGRFSGNTGNSFPDFDAGCDVGGQAEGGAPDQVLKLSLSAPRRVIFDMRGSGYQTMLSIREGTTCPGEELADACARSVGSARSFLDLDLQAGDYFVLIDGYAGASGAWKLDVFTAAL